MVFQARHNGQNYVFALLTGYRDPPAGVSVFSIPLKFLLQRKFYMARVIVLYIAERSMNHDLI